MESFRQAHQRKSSPGAKTLREAGVGGGEFRAVATCVFCTLQGLIGEIKESSNLDGVCRCRWSLRSAADGGVNQARIGTDRSRFNAPAIDQSRESLDALDILERNIQGVPEQATEAGRETLRPSTITKSSSLDRALNPRALIAHVLASICATSMPGTMRSRSGMFIGPERRMSSCVKIAAAAREIASSVFDTDTTLTFIKSSRL